MRAMQSEQASHKSTEILRCFKMNTEIDYTDIPAIIIAFIIVMAIIEGILLWNDINTHPCLYQKITGEIC